MGIIFYFMLYRPQQKERAKRAEFLKNLKKGQKVVTVSGMLAVITDLTEKTVTLEVAKGVEIKFLREAISSSAPQKTKSEEKSADA